MIRLSMFIVFAIACGPGAKGGPSMNNKIGGGNEVAKPVSPVVSADILARDPVANKAEVKHILIGWKDLGGNGRPQDKRAAARTKADAEAEVKTVLAQLQAGGEFEAFMKSHSEDPGSASTARSYTVAPDAQLVIEFRQLGLRLHVDEIGVVESEFGFHIIKRVQ